MENGISGISKLDANCEYVLKDSNWLPTPQAQQARLTATEALLKSCTGEYNAKLKQEQGRTYGNETGGMTPAEYRGHMRRMEELRKLSKRMGRLSDLRRMLHKQLSYDAALPPESMTMSLAPRDLWEHERPTPERRVANA